MTSGLPPITQNRPGPVGARARRSRSPSRAATEGERSRRDIRPGEGSGWRRGGGGPVSGGGGPGGARVRRPVLGAAGPGGGPVVGHGPVVDGDDALVGEGEAGGGPLLAAAPQEGDNGLPELVFQESAPVGGTSGVIMNTNSF